MVAATVSTRVWDRLRADIEAATTAGELPAGTDVETALFGLDALVAFFTPTRLPHATPRPRSTWRGASEDDDAALRQRAEESVEFAVNFRVRCPLVPSNPGPVAANACVNRSANAEWRYPATASTPVPVLGDAVTEYRETLPWQVAQPLRAFRGLDAAGVGRLGRILAAVVGGRWSVVVVIGLPPWRWWWEQEPVPAAAAPRILPQQRREGPRSGLTPSEPGRGGLPRPGSDGALVRNFGYDHPRRCDHRTRRYLCRIPEAHDFQDESMAMKPTPRLP